MHLHVPRVEDVYLHKDGGKYIVKAFGDFKHPVTREWIPIVGYRDIHDKAADSECYWRELPDFSANFKRFVPRS